MEQRDGEPEAEVVAAQGLLSLSAPSLVLSATVTSSSAVSEAPKAGPRTRGRRSAQASSLIQLNPAPVTTVAPSRPPETSMVPSGRQRRAQDLAIRRPILPAPPSSPSSASLSPAAATSSPRSTPPPLSCPSAPTASPSWDLAQNRVAAVPPSVPLRPDDRMQVVPRPPLQMPRPQFVVAPFCQVVNVRGESQELQCFRMTAIIISRRGSDLRFARVSVLLRCNKDRGREISFQPDLSASASEVDRLPVEPYSSQGSHTVRELVPLHWDDNSFQVTNWGIVNVEEKMAYRHAGGYKMVKTANSRHLVNSWTVESIARLPWEYVK